MLASQITTGLRQFRTICIPPFFICRGGGRVRLRTLSYRDFCLRYRAHEIKSCIRDAMFLQFRHLIYSEQLKQIKNEDERLSKNAVHDILCDGRANSVQ